MTNAGIAAQLVVDLFVNGTNTETKDLSVVEGLYSFTTQVANGAVYSVVINPATFIPGGVGSCPITGGNGTVAGADVVVNIFCQLF